MINLHPAGMRFSQAYEAHDGCQMGYGFWDGHVDPGYHASIWSGDAGTHEDLHFALPNRFGTSLAFGG